MKNKRNSRGFTLIELLIVVAIIGILGSVALPQFLGVKVRSMRTEAVIGLSQIYSGEMAFYADAHYFTPNMDQLGIKMGGNPGGFNGGCVEGNAVVCGNFFSFWIAAVSQTTFMAQANGFTNPATGPDTFVIFYP